MPPLWINVFEPVEDDATLENSFSNHQKPEKSVRIDLDSNKTRLVERLTELAGADAESLWHGRSHLDKVRANVFPILLRLDYGDKVAESSEETTRGLEYYTKYGASRRRNRKTACRQAILLEQDRQSRKAVIDSDSLAQISSHHSRQSVEEALDLAQWDEDAADISVFSGDVDPTNEGQTAYHLAKRICTWFHLAQDENIVSLETSCEKTPLLDLASEWLDFLSNS
jgi:hypothetical protein